MIQIELYNYICQMGWNHQLLVMLFLFGGWFLCLFLCFFVCLFVFPNKKTSVLGCSPLTCFPNASVCLVRHPGKSPKDVSRYPGGDDRILVGIRIPPLPISSVQLSSRAVNFDQRFAHLFKLSSDQQPLVVCCI